MRALNNTIDIVSAHRSRNKELLRALAERRHKLELLVRTKSRCGRKRGGWRRLCIRCVSPPPPFRDFGKGERDDGLICDVQEGFDGWVPWGLPKFGQPQPWSQEEITVWCAMLKREIDEGYHIYHNNKRVWAQKPFDSGPVEVVAKELELRDVERADEGGEAQGKE